MSAVGWSFPQDASENAYLAKLQETVNELNVNDWDSCGENALHRICFLGHYAAIPWLISIGAKINMKSRDGDTPLFIATYSKHSSREYECVDQLLRFGADASIGSNGYLPLLHGNATSAKLLINAYPQGVLRQDRPGHTPILLAMVLNVNIDHFRVLLEAGSLIDRRDCSGSTVFTHAVKCRRVEMSMMLLDYGAQIDEQDKTQSPFSPYVAAWDNRALCRVLTLSFLNLKRRRSSLIGRGNGRDVLRLVAQHLWSARFK